MILLITQGPFKGNKIELTSSDFSIGREDGNDLIIKDKTVSRKHAIIKFENSKYIIYDNSANGIKVNGNRAKEHELELSSKIEIGPCTFLLIKKEVDQGTISDMTIIDFADSTVEESNIFQTDEFSLGEKEKDKSSSDKKGEESSLLGTPIRKAIAILFIFIVGLFILILMDVDEEEGQSKKKYPDENQKYLTVQIEEGNIAENIPANVLSQAQQKFKEAKKYYSEKEVRKKNLYKSIVRWQEGIELLSTYKNKPAFFQENVDQLIQAKKDLFDKFERYKREINIAQKQAKYKLALEYVKIIMEFIPDKLDERYKWAKNMETIISNQIKRNR